MSIYTPHAWVIVRITIGDEQIDKVLAGWYGGYLYGDSWKLNSGITKIETVEDDDGTTWYEISGNSGSVYRCHKDVERMSGYMSQIHMDMTKKLEAEGGKVELISIGDINSDADDLPTEADPELVGYGPGGLSKTP